MTESGAKAIERIAGFIVFATWIAFFAMPFAGLQGTRDGIFITSAEWDAQAPWAIAQGTLVGLAALIVSMAINALCFAAMSRKNPLAHPTALRAFRIGFLVLLFVLPFWGWGFERSVLRVWAHESATSLEPVTIEAEVNSYYVTPGRRRGGNISRLNLRVPPYGRLQVQHHPPFRSGFEPQKGMVLHLTGRRTWVGVYYDTVQWPTDWLKEP